ncbi:MAG: hypothetical protein ORN98_05095 [Alphaproteobacteria bacterium]|nr:hypothetical protein [Alphaproteobacteria bacterium]
MPPSVLTPEIMNAVMDELKRAIEGANLTLTKNDNGQLLESIRRLGGDVRGIARPLWRAWGCPRTNKMRPRAQFWRSLAGATSLNLAIDYHDANAPGPGVILVDTIITSATVVLPTISANYHADRAATARR